MPYLKTDLLRVSRGYQSTWRVLHIDGFEHGVLPAFTGNQHYFFHYTVTPPPPDFEELKRELMECRKAPIGWRCTGTIGHDGPCAAVEIPTGMDEHRAFELLYRNHTFPHCDPKILHAPGECQFCDNEPEWQAMRIVLKINFTGHDDADKIIDPAEFARPYEKLNAWSGNKARP